MIIFSRTIILWGSFLPKKNRFIHNTEIEEEHWCPKSNTLLLSSHPAIAPEDCPPKVSFCQVMTSETWKTEDNLFAKPSPSYLDNKKTKVSYLALKSITSNNFTSFQKAVINFVFKAVFLNLRESKNGKKKSNLFYSQVIKYNFPFYINHLFSVRSRQSF